jgi:sec-independent protein translocase protein TatC
MAEEESKRENSPAASEIEEKRMSLIDHLDEFRTRLIYCIVAVCVTSAAGWWLAPVALKLMISQTGSVKYLGPTDAFMWRLRLAVILGVLIAAPAIILEIWLFIRPGLKPSERRFAFPTIFSAVTLFFAGTAAGAWSVPLTLKILEKFADGAIRPDYTIDRYVTFVGSIVISFGIVFEIPVVLVLLAKLGIVSYKMLAAGRKWAVILILIISAVITPTGDPFTLMIVSVPIYLLFEVTLIIIRFMKPPQKSISWPPHYPE